MCEAISTRLVCRKISPKVSKLANRKLIVLESQLQWQAQCGLSLPTQSRALVCSGSTLVPPPGWDRGQGWAGAMVTKVYFILRRSWLVHVGHEDQIWIYSLGTYSWSLHFPPQCTLVWMYCMSSFPPQSEHSAFSYLPFRVHLARITAQQILRYFQKTHGFPSCYRKWFSACTHLRQACLGKDAWCATMEQGAWSKTIPFTRGTAPRCPHLRTTGTAGGKIAMSESLLYEIMWGTREDGQCVPMWEKPLDRVGSSRIRQTGDLSSLKLTALEKPSCTVQRLRNSLEFWQP